MKILLPLSLILFFTACSHQSTPPSLETNVQQAITEVLVQTHRDTRFAQRDRYRNPAQTLAFFDVQATMHVGEIWPSSGWYTEILAPYLRHQGQYYAVGFSTTAKRTPQWRKNRVKSLQDKMDADPDVYDRVKVTSLSIPEDAQIAPDNSLDRVLTFRNVHNWMKGDYAQAVFDSMYQALKSGGVLGVVEHRAKAGTDLATMIKSGYVTEAQVIEYAEKSGFRLLAKSEVNANAKDSTQHPKGVWTLPPSLRLKDQDRDKYLAIGESDRMTLKFIK